MRTATILIDHHFYWYSSRIFYAIFKCKVRTDRLFFQKSFIIPEFWISVCIYSFYFVFIYIYLNVLRLCPETSKTILQLNDAHSAPLYSCSCCLWCRILFSFSNWIGTNIQWSYLQASFNQNSVYSKVFYAWLFVSLDIALPHHIVLRGVASLAFSSLFSLELDWRLHWFLLLDLLIMMIQ